MEQILDSIRKLKTATGFILSKRNEVYCPQVNGLTNICLNELGFSRESKINLKAFLRSRSFDANKNLLYREVKGRKVVTPEFNSCKNSVFALALSINGLRKEAIGIMKSLKNSLVFDSKNHLFYREFNPINCEIDTTLFVQSNLWAILALISIEDVGEAKKIMHSLEKIRKNDQCGLFWSQDCSKQKIQKRYFLDDQALAILAYLQLGEKLKAKDLIKRVLTCPLNGKNKLFSSSFSNSDIDETKSTYKNSLFAFALGKLGYKAELANVQSGLMTELFDKKEKLFNQTTKDSIMVPDNSALAVVVLNYNIIKHKIF